nr:hypothetical protein CFP56_17352 [Quercus suber]
MVCQLLVDCQRNVWEREGILGEKLWGVEENGPLLSENGEIGTIEVPIEDIGVNKEMEMEEEGSMDTQEEGKKDGGVAEKEETNLGKLASSSGWKKRKGTSSDHETNAHLGMEATSHTCVTRTKRKDKVTSDKENEEGEASAAVLFLTFGLGSCLPTKADLIRIYGKFGELKKAKIEMFNDSFCAQIGFRSLSDAIEAFKELL